jgi:hypothetical protein
MPEVKANPKMLRQPGRFSGKDLLPGQHSFITPVAAFADRYRVQTPDGTAHEIKATEYKNLKALRTFIIRDSVSVKPYPGSSIEIGLLRDGDEAAVLASFRNYLYVRLGDLEGWIEEGAGV